MQHIKFRFDLKGDETMKDTPPQISDAWYGSAGGGVQYKRVSEDTEAAHAITDRKGGEQNAPDHRIETFNAWSHGIISVLFIVFGIVRTQVDWFVRGGLAGHLTAALPFAGAFTLAASAAYHASLPMTHLTGSISGWLSFADTTSIYLSIALVALTNLSIGALRIGDIHWQAWVDFGAMVLVASTFFATVKMLTPAEAMRGEWGESTKGTVRLVASDLVHAPTRVIVSFAFVTVWLLLVPLVVDTYPRPEAWGVLVTDGIGIALLVLGQANDYTGTTDACMPDLEPKGSQGRRLDCCRRLGCSTHGIWHVLSSISVIASTIMREFALHAQAASLDKWPEEQ
jgi:predicted membrane channel-forming protein YqfA (hemolysin III family)